MDRPQQVLAALGGAANVVSVEPCLTRLRVEVTDPALVDDDALRACGALGVVHSGHVVQVIVGTGSGSLAAEIDSLS